MSRTSGASVHAVTVLMPVYNGERYLDAQIASILTQDYAALELTIIDDASTDRSPEILSSFEAKDSRVRVIRHEENRGLVRTIGELLTTVDTDFFALSDQDDIWDADKLSCSVACLVARQAALVYSDVRLCDASGQVTADSYLRSRRIRPLEGNDPLPFVFRNSVVGHTIVARREVAETVADIPANLRFHEAWIIAGACLVGSVAFCDRQLGSYRVHSDNVIGPLSHRLSHRFGSLLDRSGYLRQRQETRASALSAISLFRPDVEPVALAYATRRPELVQAVPILCRALRRCAPVIGSTHALVELLAFFAAMGLRSGTGKRPVGSVTEIQV